MAGLHVPAPWHWSRRRAHDRVRPAARAGLARVRLRAGVAVVARRAVGLRPGSSTCRSSGRRCPPCDTGRAPCRRPGSPVQVPAWQVSVGVQALPSSHGCAVRLGRVRADAGPGIARAGDVALVERRARLRHARAHRRGAAIASRAAVAVVARGRVRREYALVQGAGLVRTGVPVVAVRGEVAAPAPRDTDVLAARRRQARVRGARVAVVAVGRGAADAAPPRRTCHPSCTRRRRCTTRRCSRGRSQWRGCRCRSCTGSRRCSWAPRRRRTRPRRTCRSSCTRCRRCTRACCSCGRSPWRGCRCRSCTGSQSLQLGAAPPTHAPPAHVSFVVQALPSLHGERVVRVGAARGGATGVVRARVRVVAVGRRAPDAGPAATGVARGTRVAVVARHRVVRVHAARGRVAACRRCTGSPSLQLGAAPPTQLPPLHVSFVVHAFLSSHATVLFACAQPVSG